MMMMMARTAKECSHTVLASSRSRAQFPRAFSSPAVAVLFQDIDPPLVNGVRKPRKLGGYQDSGADIAYTLQRQGSNNVDVITPVPTPSASSQEGWCFPDTEEGILSAVEEHGATHLWANTVLFSSHPLQTSPKLSHLSTKLRIVGQPPVLAENFDDKAYLNDKLRQVGIFSLPQSWLIDRSSPDHHLETTVNSISTYPIVAKPVRGRGSHGVKVCRSPKQLKVHVESLLPDSPIVMLEEYLAGEEATVTVMPPSAERDQYWCLPPVTRFSHLDGIAPYNGVVAVTANSRVVSRENMNDPAYQESMEQCAGVARLIKATAPIRIDVRRRRDGGEFVLFDVNLKPNMTGPGRPCREDQASLSVIAAAGIGWDYLTLLMKMLQSSSSTLAELRGYVNPF